MDNSMQWYLSKTIWASLAVIVSALLGPFGIDIGAETQTQLVDLILAIITAVGGLVAIYGRVTATKVISPPTAPTE